MHVLFRSFVWMNHFEQLMLDFELAGSLEDACELQHILELVASFVRRCKNKLINTLPIYKDLSQHLIVPHNNSDIVWIHKTFIFEFPQKFVGDGVFPCLHYILQNEDFFLGKCHVPLAYGGIHMRNHVDTFDCAVGLLVLDLFLDEVEAW